MSPRRSIAILIFAALLLAMAAGQLATLDAFAEALRGYRALGDAADALAVVVPLVELAAAAGLLLGRRAGGVLGLAVAVFWSTLAAQAFARGLALDNCGCFGGYLAQSLRWWILVEDAEFLLLAWWAGARAGLPLPLPRLSRDRRGVAESAVAQRRPGDVDELEPVVDR